MHVHANYSLQLACLGDGGQETRQIAAKRAAEVRRKLSSPLSAMTGAGEAIHGASGRPEQDRERRQGEGDTGEFGRLFSARA